MSARSILVVDDEEPVRQLVQATLRREGHRVESAGDAVLALKKLREGPFEVLITDLLMPERDGIELMREVRRDFPALRIIAMSGGGRVGSDAYLKLAKGIGAHVLLAKPFLPRELFQAVENACEANLGSTP